MVTKKEQTNTTLARAPSAIESNPPSFRWLQRFLSFAVNEFDGIAIVIGMVSLAIAGVYGSLPIAIGASSLFCGGIGIRVYRVRYDLTELSNSIKSELAATVSEIKAETALVRNDVTSLREEVATELTHQAEVCDRQGFYRHMIKALRNARRTVDLTQLDQYAPRHFGTPEMEEYFQLQAKVVREQPNMVFRRVVAIPTLEKLEWVLETVEKAADCLNFQINIVTLQHTNTVPAPISLQIFDRQELCIVDPALGEMKPTPQPKMLWLSGKAATEVFSTYYDRLWDLSTPLKSGSLIYWQVLEDKLTELEATNPSQQNLISALRSRINALQGKPN